MSFTGAELAVTPRPLTIAPDAVSRLYGVANPATGQATGDNLINGDAIDSVDLSSTATQTSGVGRYALTAANAAHARWLERYPIRRKIVRIVNRTPDGKKFLT